MVGNFARPGAGAARARKRRAKPAGDAMMRCALCRAEGLRRGQATGLPEQEHLLQAAENAHQAGDDQRVDGRRQPDTLLLRLRIGAQAGDLVAQEG